MNGVTGSMAVWDLMRATGIVSLLLLTTVVCLGIASAGGVRLGILPRVATLAVHRSVALLSVVFLAIHVTSAIVDPYASVAVVNLIVPFTSAFKPLGVGLGALALDLIAALIVTSLLRARIGRRAWAVVHAAAYGAWPLAFVHGLATGTDSGTIWMRGVALGCLVAVGTAIGWRTLIYDPERAAQSPPRSGRTAIR